MRKADFQARIKKIEIVNRTLTDTWSQAIRVVLDEIQLTNENLLELKQFRPNEPILVEITPVQVSLTDPLPRNPRSEEDDTEEAEAFSFLEGEPEKIPPEAIAKEWKFGA